MELNQSNHLNSSIINATINYEDIIENLESELEHSKYTNLKLTQDFNNQIGAKKKF